MVLLTGDVELRLLKEYEGNFLYGNLVKKGIYNVWIGSILSMNYKHFTQFWDWNQISAYIIYNAMAKRDKQWSSKYYTKS